jgi:hypothetical protein
MIPAVTWMPDHKGITVYMDKINQGTNTHVSGPCGRRIELYIGDISPCTSRR